MQQAWSYSVNNFGVYVLEVIGESAKNAGLKIGDVIVKFDGEEIKSITDLRTVLCNYSAGDIVEIEVVRGQTTLTLILKLEQKK